MHQLEQPGCYLIEGKLRVKLENRDEIGQGETGAGVFFETGAQFGQARRGQREADRVRVSAVTRE